VSGLAAPHRRAEALAGFFLAGYVGISVPVLGLGVLDQMGRAQGRPARLRGAPLAGLAASARSLRVGERRAPVHRRPLAPAA